MNTPVPNSRTPILDLESPLPAKKRDWDRLTWPQAILIVVLPIFAIAVIIPASLAINQENPTVASFLRFVHKAFNVFGDQNPAILLLIYFLAIFLFVFIHEFGHVAGGLAVGFEFERIVIGPFTFAKSDNKLKFSIQRLLSFDGLAAMKIQPLRKVRRRVAIFIAAAPLVNLVSVGCVWIFLEIPLSTAIPPIARRSLEFFAALSVLIVIGNLIPFIRRNGMYTDGARLLSLARSLPETRRFICLQALKTAVDSGVRLKNLKQTWIAHACAVDDQSIDGLRASWLAYLVNNDRNEPEKAAEYLEKCLQRFVMAPPEFKKLFLMEAAIFQAWFRDDQQKAKFWQEKAEALSTKAQPLNEIRFTISMNFVKHRDEEVDADWERGRHLIEALPQTDGNRRLASIWLEWKKQLEDKRAGRSSATS